MSKKSQKSIEEELYLDCDNLKFEYSKLELETLANKIKFKRIFFKTKAEKLAFNNF